MAGIRAGVFFGGPSAEHEVSIRSADCVAEALQAAGCELLLIHLRRDGTWALARPRSAAEGADAATRLSRQPQSLPLDEALRQVRAEIEVAFPIVHGTLGEDGSLQGFLRVLGIPWAGPGVLASALAMDKGRAKSVLAATTSLKMPLGAVVRATEPPAERAAAFAKARTLVFPVIVKPVDAGSSVGLSRVEGPEGLEDAIALAFAVEGVTGVLVEEIVPGDEVTCAVFGNPERGVEALPPVLIRPRDGRMFDYEAKYTAGLTDEICPAPLPAPQLDRIRAAATTAYVALGCRGFARVDFIMRDGVPWFLELNSLPGVTRESLLPKAALAAGWTLPDFFLRLVELALEGENGRVRAAVAK
jgi:D-alanine-D-alanine ligase